MKVIKKGVAIELDRWEAKALSDLLEIARVAMMHTKNLEPVNVGYIMYEYEPDDHTLDDILSKMFDALN